MNKYTIKKSLNNNVLVANNDQQVEVVLIGKGIGFHYKPKDVIYEEAFEKLFVLRDIKEQQHYKELLPHIDEEMLQTIISSLELIRRKSNTFLNEYVHVALTDHLVFATNRFLRGLSVKNPFLSETKALYPFAYEIASEVVDLIDQSLNINLPEGEIGFIALHIHSAITHKDIAEINKYSQLVTQLIEVIEEKLDIAIDKDSIHYIRLVRHLRYTIERVMNEEEIEEQEKIALLLKNEYPICYSLSWKLIKMMQQTLKKPVYNAEAVYLTLHLQRLKNKFKH